MTAQNTDYDAAQALLDLQGNVKQENSGAYVWRGSNVSEEKEHTAKLFWNCFISSEIPVVAVSSHNRNEPILNTTPQENSDSQCPKAFKQFENYSSNKLQKRLVCNINGPKHYINYEAKRPKIKDSPSIPRTLATLPLIDTVETCNEKNKTKTREIETQTEEPYLNPHIEFMESTIKNLCDRIQSLETQLKQSNLPDQTSVLVGSENENDQSYESRQSMDCNNSMDENTIGRSKKVEFSKMIKFEDSHDFKKDKTNDFNSKVITSHNNYSYPSTSDLVPIGDGHAVVPARLLRHINWNSYTSATRKLLTAVFSRRILATHSLTGKPSPAFPNKPAKKRLDPGLVNDIVQTVVERCSVPENVVRTSITTKCADESKMFKTRQGNKKRRSSKKNCENIPPTTSESESEEY